MLKISVVVPVYNVELYIRECLESIVNQTYSNIEIILVDDGSTDASGLICDEYAQKDSRIVVVHKANGGLVSARKAGVLLATGEYVTYVDSDDWIDLNLLEKIIDKMGNSLPDIIAFGHVKEYPGSPDKRPENIKNGMYSVDDIEELTEIAMSNEDYFYTQILSGLAWGKLFKKNIIVEAQTAVSDTIRIGEDLAVFNRCYIKSNSVMVYNLCAYHYRIRENSLTKNIDNQEYFRFLEFVKCLKEGIVDKGSRKIPKRFIYDIFFQSIVSCSEKVLEKSNTNLNLFSGVTKGSRIIIYGKGVFSKGMAEYIYRTDFVELAGIIDSSDRNRIFEMGDYDHLVIAITNGKLVERIQEELVNIGVDERKIVYIKNTDLKVEKLPKEVISIIGNVL